MQKYATSSAILTYLDDHFADAPFVNPLSAWQAPAYIGKLLNFQTTVENLDIPSIIKLKYYGCRFLRNSMNNDINSGIVMKYMQTYAPVGWCSICGIVKNTDSFI